MEMEILLMFVTVIVFNLLCDLPYNYFLTKNVSIYENCLSLVSCLVTLSVSLDELSILL